MRPAVLPLPLLLDPLHHCCPRNHPQTRRLLSALLEKQGNRQHLQHCGAYFDGCCPFCPLDLLDQSLRQPGDGCLPPQRPLFHQVLCVHLWGNDRGRSGFVFGAGPICPWSHRGHTKSQKGGLGVAGNMK